MDSCPWRLDPAPAVPPLAVSSASFSAPLVVFVTPPISAISALNVFTVSSVRYLASFAASPLILVSIFWCLYVSYFIRISFLFYLYFCVHIDIESNVTECVIPTSCGIFLYSGRRLLFCRCRSERCRCLGPSFSARCALLRSFSRAASAAAATDDAAAETDGAIFGFDGIRGEFRAG